MAACIMRLMLLIELGGRTAKVGVRATFRQKINFSLNLVIEDLFELNLFCKLKWPHCPPWKTDTVSLNSMEQSQFTPTETLSIV